VYKRLDEGDGARNEPVTLGLVAAAKLRVLPGRADATLFHRVPERARLAASMAVTMRP
jgi:hypothetical protein